MTSKVSADIFMKAYYWCNGALSPGIPLPAKGFGKNNEPAIMLGSVGPRGKYRATCFHRSDPPILGPDMILREADPHSIEGQENFFVLRKSFRPGFLVQINTKDSYCKSTDSFAELITGSAIKISRGSTFDKFIREDSLWEMHEGDALRVRGCLLNKSDNYVIWADEFGLHSDYERVFLALYYFPKSEKVLSLDLFDWRMGNLTKGIPVQKKYQSNYFSLGKDADAEIIPVIACRSSIVKQAALMRFAGSRREDPLFSLCCDFFSEDEIEKSFLLRVSAQGNQSKNSRGETHPLKGFPEEILNVSLGTYTESLVIMREGDAICIKPEGAHDMISYVVYVQGNELKQEEAISFKIQDMEKDPEFWVAEGFSLVQNTPTEWIGKTVDCFAVKEDFKQSDIFGLKCFSSRLKSRGKLLAFKINESSVTEECLVVLESNTGQVFEANCEVVSLPNNQAVCSL